MVRLYPCFLVAALVSGCVSSETADPAEGGFFAGVSGIASGGYDARIAEQEGEVASAEARNAALALEESSLRAQLASASRSFAAEKTRLRDLSAARADLDPGTRASVQEVLARQPTGRTDADRLAALQKAIADARALSAELARL